jgi:hypothetical protein
LETLVDLRFEKHSAKPIIGIVSDMVQLVQQTLSGPRIASPKLNILECRKNMNEPKKGMPRNACSVENSRSFNFVAAGLRFKRSFK